MSSPLFQKLKILFSATEKAEAAAIII